MPFNPIDYEKWERKEIYEHFKGTVMYTTVQMDISRLLQRVKSGGQRLYPALIHCIAAVVNSCADYRYGLVEGNIGWWDAIHPCFTVPRKGKPELFSMAVTSYEDDFGAFLQRWLADYARAETCGRLMSDAWTPDTMGITAAPGLPFTSFAFSDADGKEDFAPFIIIGKYELKGDRVIMPVCGEFVHSVNDGYHVSRFFELLQKRFDAFECGAAEV